MSFTRTFAKNVFFKGGGEIVIRLLSFAFIVMVARVLGDEDFGVLNFAMSFALLFVVVVDFGFNPLLVRDAAREPGRIANLFFNLFIVKLILGLLFLLAVTIGLQLLAPSPAMRRAGYWLAAFVMLNSFTEFINAVFHAHQRMQYEAATLTLQKLGLLVFGLLALSLGLGVFGVAAAYVAAGAVGLLVAVVVLWRGKFLLGEWKFNPAILKYAFRQALPLTLTTLFINLYFRIDMTLLAKFRPAAEVGWYGAAHKCIEVLMVVPAVLVVASFPGFSKLYFEDREKLTRAARQVLRLLLLLGLPLAGGAALVGRPLMATVFGPDFAAAGPALGWLALALSFIFLNYALSYLLITGEKQVVNALVSGLAVIVSVSANLLLIPRYGYLGAAGAAVITELFLLAAYAWAVQRWLFRLSLWPALLRTGLAVSAMMLVVWPLRGQFPLISILAGMVVYALAAWLFKAVGPEDLRILRRVFQQGEP